MKKIKIGLTAFALLAGIVSVFASRASRFSGTTYWKDTAGVIFQGSAAPAECTGGSTLCASAYNSLNHLTGTTAQIAP